MGRSLIKLGSLLGSFFIRVPHYFGGPKKDPNSENYVHEQDMTGTQGLGDYTWFLSSLFIVRVPFFLLFGFSKGALK